MIGVNMHSGVYYVWNTHNDRVYIGQSRDLQGRICSHFTALIERRHINLLWQVDFDTYGLKAFEAGILADCPFGTPSSELQQWERHWINFYQSENPQFGYNVDRKALSQRVGERRRIETARKRVEGIPPESHKRII